jgi:mono/diheme cytochrome c family protein
MIQGNDRSFIMRRLPPAVMLAVAVVAALGMTRHEPPPEAPPVAAAVVPSAERGHALVKRDCGGCHAVEADGDSPLARAPAFRTLHDKYPLEALEEALAEGILSGHPAMPEYEYAPEEIDDIIAWMRTLDAP